MSDLDDKTVARFWSKVNKDGPVHPALGTPCWMWIPPTSKRYAQFKIDGKHHAAHRVSYRVLVGDVPAGLELDHLCRVRMCVNPAHLEPVTHHENLLRGNAPAAINKRKTHCQNGHEFAGDNLVHTVSRGRPSRLCRTCLQNRKRRGYPTKSNGMVPTQCGRSTNTSSVARSAGLSE